MKSVTKLFILIAILSFQSCIEECGDCFTPPSGFVFELVDKESGENLFTNGTYNSSDIEILNLADSSAVEFGFIDENDINVIVINTIGWKTEIVNYSSTVSGKSVFNLHVDAERLMGECCSYTIYNAIEITDAEFVQDNSSGIFRILIE